MKKGICLTAIYPEAMYNCSLLLGLLERTAQEKIFDCVEFYFQGTREEEYEIRSQLEKLKLSAVFHGGFPMKRDRIDISAKEEGERLKSVEICSALYESACRMGADKMLILSGPSWNVRDEEGLIRQTRKSLMELAGKIKDGSPSLTLEYFNDQGEPWLAVGDILLVRKIFEGMDLPRVEITFDTSHTIQMNRDILKSFRILRPWIRHLHLANSVSMDPDSQLFGDKHPLFDAEGGDFSLAEIKRLYSILKEENLLENVEICSMEIISRGSEESYYRETCKQAENIWN